MYFNNNALKVEYVYSLIFLMCCPYRYFIQWCTAVQNAVTSVWMSVEGRRCQVAE